jgi:hypothetical protein
LPDHDVPWLQIENRFHGFRWHNYIWSGSSWSRVTIKVKYFHTIYSPRRFAFQCMIIDLRDRPSRPVKIIEMSEKPRVLASRSDVNSLL